MHARSLQSFVTELTRAIREGEWHDDEIAAFDGAHIPANIRHDPDRFMAHDAPDVAVFHIFVWPQVTPANARASDTDDCVGRLD